MKLSIRKTGGVPFAKKAPYEYNGENFEADIKNGDVITILDAGTEEEGQWGKQTNFRIKTRNGEKKLNFNQSSINVLIQEFGEDTEGWIGKDAKIITKKDVIAGRKVEVAYVVVESWSLDDYGELVKDGMNKGAELEQDPF